MSDTVEPVPSAPAASTGAAPEDAARRFLGTPAYAPIGPGARVTYAWATLIALVGIYIISVVPAVIAVVVVVIPIAATTGITWGTDGTIPREIELPALATAIIIQFPAWALLVIAWVRGFERRSLASAGFQGPFVLRRYAIGLVVGVATAAVLALLSPIAAPELTAEMVDFDLTRVLRWDWMLLLTAVVLVFLVQGAAEEVACRGWMLSAIAIRRGLVAAVLINSIVFASLHSHFFRGDALEVTMIFVVILIGTTLTGWFGRWGLIASFAIGALILALTPWSLSPTDLVFGLISMSAIALVGLFMSLWAVRERSIIGVCGIHGAFNATAVVMSMVAVAATTPDSTPGEVLLQTLREATGQGGEVSFGGVVLQFVLFASLSGLVWRWLSSRRPEFR